MPGKTDSHLASLLMAMLVTTLWSTSWIIIKAGLSGLPPIFMAGLRYATAAVVLFPVALRRDAFRPARRMTRREAGSLLAMGIVFYGITQGGVFFSLSVMSATRLSLILSASTVIVALGSALFLREHPAVHQWFGTVVYLAGVLLFLSPFDGTGSLVAVIAGVATLIANSASSLLTRAVNRTRLLDPLGVTTISAAIGGAGLLVAGALIEGVPRLSLAEWGFLGWLAVVNTAFAFTLWNRAARELTALESSVINNTMIFQVALLSWVVLGENLGPVRVAALIIATGGVLLVQIPRQRLLTVLSRFRSRFRHEP